MEDALELADLIDQLHRGFDQALDVEATALHVQLRVPLDSQYEWFDEYGAVHRAHLPTGVETVPTTRAATVEEEGGPSVVLELPGDGDTPEHDMVVDLAHSLYRQAIAWGQQTYGTGEPIVEEPMALPIVFEQLVGEALDSDAQRHRN